MLAAAMATAASFGFTGTAAALELRDEPLSIAGDRTTTQDEPVGESVGEPSAEDAPVEGEPGAGEAPKLPLDEPVDDAGKAVPPAAPGSDAAKH
jgi:hypothetical protein